MAMSDRISWHTCPVCGARAAVGWVGSAPVEMDCYNHCDLTASNVGLRFGVPSSERPVPPTTPSSD